MSQAPPRSNFMQTLMLALVIFLGLQIFMNSKGTPDTRSSDEILVKVRDLNRKHMDLSILSEKARLLSAIDSEEKAGKLTRDAADKKRLEAEVLVADAQYKAGITRKDLPRLTNAFTTLQGSARSLQGKPLWEKEVFNVPGHRDFPATSYTANQLYTKIVDELKSRGKTDLVWGVVPGYQLIDTLVNLTGRAPAYSYMFAALLLAFFVRLLVFPLAQKQYIFGKKMQQLQPRMQEIKELYTDKKTGQVTDPTALNMRMMQMYKEYGFNPLQGCWPMLIQIPLFWLIYQCMLHYRFEFRNGTFLWINPQTAMATNGWTAPNLGEMDYLLIVVYAISMVVTTFLSPVSDPANAKQQRRIGTLIALIFSVMMFFYPLPSAFVLYWTFVNIFATAQMLWVYKNMDVPPMEPVNAPGGGVYPSAPKPAGQFQSTGIPVKHKPKKKK